MSWQPSYNSIILVLVFAPAVAIGAFVIAALYTPALQLSKIRQLWECSLFQYVFIME